MVKQKQKHDMDQLSLKITRSIGTPTSIVIHTLFFAGIFFLKFIGIDTETILLVLTTAVSLEAIYLAIFIQMSVNRQAASLESVEDNLEDIQEDVKGLEDDVEGISEDVEDISEDIDQIQAEETDEQQTTTLRHLEKQLQSIQKDLEILHNKGLF